MQCLLRRGAHGYSGSVWEVVKLGCHGRAVWLLWVVRLRIQWRRLKASRLVLIPVCTYMIGVRGWRELLRELRELALLLRRLLQVLGLGAVVRRNVGDILCVIRMCRRGGDNGCGRWHVGRVDAVGVRLGLGIVGRLVVVLVVVLVVLGLMKVLALAE